MIPLIHLHRHRRRLLALTPDDGIIPWGGESSIWLLKSNAIGLTPNNHSLLQVFPFFISSPFFPCMGKILYLKTTEILVLMTVIWCPQSAEMISYYQITNYSIFASSNSIECCLIFVKHDAFIGRKYRLRYCKYLMYVSFVWFWYALGNLRFPERFTVASYNILADRNASEHRDLYLNVPSRYVKWDYRKRVICKEIFGWDPDIICLQVRYRHLFPICRFRRDLIFCDWPRVEAQKVAYGRLEWCCQEVDKYAELSNILVKAGYKGSYKV